MQVDSASSPTFGTLAGRTELEGCGGAGKEDIDSVYFPGDPISYFRGQTRPQGKEGGGRGGDVRTLSPPPQQGGAGGGGVEAIEKRSGASAWDLVCSLLTMDQADKVGLVQR
jgi:hypothetical protein